MGKGDGTWASLYCFNCFNLTVLLVNMFNAKKKKFNNMGHCTDWGPGVRKQYVVNICDG